jgi:hypothetical protein
MQRPAEKRTGAQTCRAHFIWLRQGRKEALGGEGGARARETVSQRTVPQYWKLSCAFAVCIVHAASPVYISRLQPSYSMVFMMIAMMIP